MWSPRSCSLRIAGDPLPDGGVVAVAGQVDEAGEEAAVDVAAHEQLQLAALAGVHHLGGDRHEVVDRGLEQLVARIGLQHVHQRLAGVAHRVQADDVDHLCGLLAQHRDPAYGLGVGGRGEQAEEAALADDLAVVVELLHADVVEEDRAVHGRLRVGLGQHQEVLVACAGGHRLREHARGRRVGAQDAEAGAGHGDQRLLVAVGLEDVLAVAEEGEVVVGQPAQQGGALLDLVVGERWRVLLDVLDDPLDLGVHPLPVLDGVTDVDEHLGQLVLDLADLVVGDPVDLEVHPRLAGHVVRVGLGLLVEHLVRAGRRGRVVRRTAGGSPGGCRAGPRRAPSRPSRRGTACRR